MPIYDPNDFNKDGSVNVLDIIEKSKANREAEQQQLESGTPNVLEIVEDVNQLQDISASALAGTGGTGAMKEAARITPLQSIPAISQVGAVPFSGSVNWNAIPGGFQPLPQVVGGRKKLYQLSQFHGGINQKSSARDIADNECQEALNVSFSNIGRIKTAGVITGTSSGLATAALASSATHIPCAGYGLYIFKSGYSLEATPTQGDYTIVASTDGEHVVVKDSTTAITDANTWLTIAGEAVQVAPVFYAAGGGLYVNDANFTANHTTSRQCARLVYREDAGSSQTVQGWKTGEALIASPTYDSDADGDMAAGTVKCTHDGGTSSVASTLIAECDPNGTGTWNSTYYFYISWLFDDGCETGLTSFADDGGDDQSSNGIAFSDNQLELNVSLMHTPHASNNTELGADKRIEGFRIYFRDSASTAERWLLAEGRLVDGIRGALDSTYLPWTDSSDVYSHTTIKFADPPEVYSYSSLNGYYANEVYSESKDVLSSTNAGPTASDVRYKTAVVGQQGNVFIGNVIFNGKAFPDGMMFSMPGQPGVFPQYNMFDSPSSDGSPITALASFQDTILQFKENAMYVINVSNPQQFYAEASFRDCGVANPCQVFTTAFGVIFANRFGCFIYDGQKVISLTNGKFHIDDWGITEEVSIEDDTASVPCVGYDPRGQNIVVLKNIGHEADNTGTTNESAWIYYMPTQSWREGADMITNGDGVRHSNFQISPNGYLSICQSSEETLLTFPNYPGQSITYWTKDMDFGVPTQTKRLFKVYITYKGDASGLYVRYGLNGETGTTDNSDLLSFATASYGGTEVTQPLADKSSTANLEHWHVATLYPDTISEGKDWNSISIYIQGIINSAVEINDISILYRLRPIK